MAGEVVLAAKSHDAAMPRLKFCSSAERSSDVGNSARISASRSLVGKAASISAEIEAANEEEVESLSALVVVRLGNQSLKVGDEPVSSRTSLETRGTLRGEVEVGDEVGEVAEIGLKLLGSS